MYASTSHVCNWLSGWAGQYDTMQYVCRVLDLMGEKYYLNVILICVSLVDDIK